MNKVKEFPVLYKQRKDGAFQIQNIYVTGHENGNYSIVTVHGTENGKMQTDVKEVTSGKNIGKANETSIKEQAISQAFSKWKRKQDKGYQLKKITKSEAEFRPMLAYDAKDRLKSIFNKAQKEGRETLTFHTQPKLDGIRCSFYRSEDSVIAVSRTGQPYTHLLEHIVKDLEWIPDNLVVDGEIYSFVDGIEIQEIAGLMNRKSVSNQHKKLSFVIFDYYDTEKPSKAFGERWKENSALTRSKIKELNIKTLRLVDDSDLFSAVCKKIIVKLSQGVGLVFKHAEKIHEVSCDMGFEGIMLRDADSEYILGSKTINLLKFKKFDDSEFEIVDIITPETGRTKGMALFVCKTESGLEFEADSTGKAAYRKWLYENRKSLIGKQLKVQYQGFTNKGIPRFPKGLEIRDYE